MNEQNNEPSPEDLLTQGVDALIGGISEGSTDDSASTENAEQSSENRATQDESDNGENSQKEGSESSASTTNSAKAKSANGTQTPPKKQTASDRIRELNEQKKAAESKAQALEDRLSKLEQKVTSDPKDAKEKEIPSIIPKPQTPKYSMEQLQKLRAEAKASGDEKLLEAVEEEINAWRDYKVDLAAWEVKNGHAYERKQGLVQFYRTEAAKKYPELKDSNSQMFKTYKNLEQRFPELIARDDGTGEYWAAIVSDVLVKHTQHESVVGALKSENEKLRAEVDKLTKKLVPGKKASGEADLGDNSDEDPDAAFSRGLRELERA